VVSDKFSIHPAKIVAFEGDSTTVSQDEEYTYYVPIKFNFKAINVLLCPSQPEKEGRSPRGDPNYCGKEAHRLGGRILCQIIQCEVGWWINQLSTVLTKIF